VERVTGWWRERARALKRSVHALYLAAGHPRTPWYAKALAALVAGYALSPIDLIPDPIPILGYLDDLVLLPVGVWITLKLIPDDVWEECRAKAAADEGWKGPTSRVAAGVIVLLWILAAYLVVRGVVRFSRSAGIHP
jgi:uncharacterized membrane protein YkvA (DUF1232 family)